MTPLALIKICYFLEILFPHLGTVQFLKKQERMEFVPRPREPRSGKKEKFREEKDLEKGKVSEGRCGILGKSEKI